MATFALAVVVSLLFVVAACGDGAGDATDGEPSADASGTATAGYTDITPDELAAMLEDKDLVLVNTHIPYEGEIEQTDLFLPYDQAAALVSELPRDKDAKIVVYCRSDRMSSIAAAEWAKAGYTRLYNLDGGFEAWEAEGYDLLYLPQD